MRLHLLLFAAAAGLAAAQITTGPSEDIGQCIVACAEKAARDNPGEAKKCDGIKDRDKQAQCFCQSDASITDVGTCMTSTCPALLAETDVIQGLRQTCAKLNSAPSVRAGGLFTVVAAAGALIAGVVF